MDLTCVLSKEKPNQPVVSPVSGGIFERRLIIKYLQENNNRDPINGNVLNKDQLINLDLNIPEHDLNMNYRKETEYSIPELIKYLQEKWDELILEKFNLQKQLDASRRECKETMEMNEMLKRELFKQRDRKYSINDQIHCNSRLNDNIYSNLPSMDSINKENHNYDATALSINSSNGLSSLSDQTKYHLANNQFKNTPSLNHSLVHSTNYSSTNSKFSDHHMASVFGNLNTTEMAGCKFNNTYKQSRLNDLQSPKFTDLTNSSNKLDQSSLSFQKYNNKQLSYSNEYVNLNSKLVGRTHRAQSVIIQNDSPFEIELNGMKSYDENLDSRIDYFNQPNWVNSNRKMFKPVSEQITPSSSGSLRGSYINNLNNNLSNDQKTIKRIPNDELYCNLIDRKEFDQISLTSKKQNLGNYENILMFDEDPRNSQQSINKLEHARMENSKQTQILKNKNEKDRNGPNTKLNRAETWSKDFDNLLNDKFGINIFENFLRDELSVENISFWKSCEDYKKMFESIVDKEVKEKAKRIYNEFFEANRINITAPVREKVKSNYKNPTKDLFADAQKEIYILMRNDSYKRFLQSEKYKKALMDCENNLLSIELINNAQFELNNPSLPEVKKTRRKSLGMGIGIFSKKKNRLK